MRRLLLRDPPQVHTNLTALHGRGLIDEIPTDFQVAMGVAYMAHRIVLRPQTIGIAPDVPMRDTPRARWLSSRLLRLPFLVREGLIHPFELTGLATPPRTLRAHVVGTYHPGDNALYDLSLLAAHEGELDRLLEEVGDIVSGAHPRGIWLADLCVYEGYHDHLLGLVERSLTGDLEPVDPNVPSDASLRGFVCFLCSQPRTPREALAALARGELRLGPA